MTGTLSRRSFLGTTGKLIVASAVGGTLLSACGKDEESGSGPSGTATSKLTFLSPFALSLSYLAVINGRVGETFADENLDLELASAQGSSAAMQQIIVGNADITQGGADTIMNAVFNENAPLRAIATESQAPIYALISSADNPITEPSQLVGKTIGVASVGGETEQMVNLMALTGGEDPDSVEKVAVGISLSTVELLKSGKVDAFTASATYQAAMRHTNAPVHIMPFSKYITMPGQVYIVTEKTLNEKAEALSAFVKGLRSSMNQILDAGSLQTIAADLKDAYGTQVEGLDDPELAAAQIDARSALWAEAGKENVAKNVPATWQAAAETLISADVLPAGSDPATVFTNELFD